MVSFSSSLGYPPPGFESKARKVTKVQMEQRQQVDMRLKKQLQTTDRREEQKESDCWVFIHNIPPNTSGIWLEELLSEEGRVNKVEVPTRPNLNGRWFAFLQFENQIYR